MTYRFEITCSAHECKHMKTSESGDFEIEGHIFRDLCLSCCYCRIKVKVEEEK